MLCSLMPADRWVGLVWLLLMGAWLYLEFRYGPPLMEYGRQWPAMREGQPLPLVSRDEALYWLWRVQCVGMFVYLIIRWIAG